MFPPAANQTMPAMKSSVRLETLNISVPPRKEVGGSIIFLSLKEWGYRAKFTIIGKVDDYGPYFTASSIVEGFPPSCKAGAANGIARARFDIVYGMTLASEHQRALVQMLRPRARLRRDCALARDRGGASLVGASRRMCDSRNGPTTCARLPFGGRIRELRALLREGRRCQRRRRPWDIARHPHDSR